MVLFPGTFWQCRFVFGGGETGGTSTVGAVGVLGSSSKGWADLSSAPEKWLSGDTDKHMLNSEWA